MGLILNIETATEVCSVNLAKDGVILAQRETNEDKSHATRLAVYIDEIFKELGKGPKELDAVAVSMGPGSYTGLRIGVSVAKGLCYGAGKPLIAVPTLLSLAKLASTNLGIETKDHVFCPMIDARRMEVYAAIYDADLKELVETKAYIIDKDSFSEVLKDKIVYFFGNGSAKCKEHIDHPNARFIDEMELSASGMVELSNDKLSKKELEDVAYFEPFYLKDFIAIKAKNKVLGGK